LLNISSKNARLFLIAGQAERLMLLETEGWVMGSGS